MNTGLSSVLSVSGSEAFAWDGGTTAALVEAGWLLTHCPLAPGAQEQPHPAASSGPNGYISDWFCQRSELTENVCGRQVSHSKGNVSCEFVKNFFSCHKDVIKTYQMLC